MKLIAKKKTHTHKTKLYFCVGKVLGKTKNRVMELSGGDLL